MELHIHVHHHGRDDGLSGVETTLGVLAKAVEELACVTRRQGEVMTGAMQKLTDEVAQAKQVGASAVKLLNGLAQQIRDTAGDEEAAKALADDLDTSTKELADAVTANTPAAPVAPADPSAANA